MRNIDDFIKASRGHLSNAEQWQLSRMNWHSWLLEDLNSSWHGSVYHPTHRETVANLRVAERELRYALRVTS